ncbi:MAG: SPOR domain-containing protein [Magnetococcales bacterium]|nr:SPOR domain-containing protein [Magnetococcales bacterium]
MATTYTINDKTELSKMEKFDSSDLDWSTIEYGSKSSVLWWRIFIWVLTIIAIAGMALALFWWQMDRGGVPGSSLSLVQVAQNSPPGQRDAQEPTPNNQPQPTTEHSFPQPEEGGRYMVLAGSFINEQNAKRIFDQLQQTGVPVRAKRAMVNGQRHTHLLVGPYVHQHSAEKAVAQIQKQTGLPVDYTTLDLEGIDKDKEETVSFSTYPNQDEVLHPDQFVVLAGSFTDQVLARRVQNRLEKEQITANLKEVHDQDRIFFHVVVGPFRLSTQANDMVEIIRKKTGILAESSQIL